MRYELNPSILSWPLFRRSGAWQVLTILLIKADDTGRSMTNRQHIENITGLSAVTVGAIMRDIAAEGIIEEDGDAIWVKRLPTGCESILSIVEASKPRDIETSTQRSLEASKPRGAGTSRFVKPTLEDVATYITLKGYHFSAEEFVAHYESNGWRVGRNPMKKWQAACVTFERTWKRDQERYQQRLNQPHHAQPNNYQQQRDNARRLFAASETKGYVTACQLGAEEPILLPE